MRKRVGVRAGSVSGRRKSSTKLPGIRPCNPRSCRAWSKDLRTGTAFAALFALGLIGTVPAAKADQSALPTGGTVTQGDASISGSGDGLLINQTSGSAIISWDTFSVGAGGTVHFNNGSGATLNRVTGNVPSSIDGSLSATGSLYLVNSAGVVVGTGGMVATGGTFAASTHDVSDADFLDGGDMAFAGDSKAGIINHGTISSAMGDVALIARRVENTGDISAPNGTAALLAGYDVLMQETSGPNGKFVVRAGGSDTEVVNSGTINAAEVELRANGGNVLALAGNTKGVVKATGVSKRGGRIFLTAGGGKVQAGGRMSARRRVSSGGAAEQGGDVFINADTVVASANIDVSGFDAAGGNIDIGGRDIALTGATLDASGRTGGGRIRVGGEYQGGEDLATDEVENADTLLIDAASVLRADGTGATADGGSVIAWADDHTDFFGSISAAAHGSGHGGFIETSGKVTINLSGEINAASATGQSGKWLIDPGAFDLNGPLAAFLGGVLGSGTDVDIVTFLGTIPDTITTSAALTVDFASHNSTDDEATLTVTAGDTVTISNAVTALNGVLNLDINADNTLTINAAIDTNGGDVGIRTDALALNSTLNAGAGTVTITPVSSGHDIDIGGADAAGTLGLTNAEINAITAGALLIGTTANGEITVSSDIGLNSAMTLALASRGDITANASIQNAGSGDLALIAGWDGVTTNPASFLSATLATQTLFGNGGGSVFIGDGAQSAGIAVGSRDGTTSVLTSGLSILGSTTTASSFAQLGFQATDEGSASTVGGAIQVRATGGITATGGSQSGSYAQIGHVGSDLGATNTVDEAAVDAAITIEAGGNISFAAGSASGSHSQLGHGGFRANGDFAGDITISSANELLFEGGTGSVAYSQIGHGGWNADGEHSGAIDVTASGTVTFVGGSSTQSSYTLLGHGGDNSGGANTGDITLVSSSELTFEGGTGSGAFSQLGHGGTVAGGNHSGVINVSGTDLTLEGGSAANTYAMIGLGDLIISNAGTRNGDINISLSGGLMVQDGTGASGAGALIGHKTLTLGSTAVIGDITILANDMSLDGEISSPDIVTLAPFTAGREITLGTEVGGTLSLTDSEIDTVTADILRIGSSTAGSVSITDSISPAGTDTLSLITGDKILDANNITDVDIEVASLALRAVNGIADNERLDTDIDTLAALNTADNSISIIESRAGGSLAIGAVDGLTGVVNQGSGPHPGQISIQIETDDGDLTVASGSEVVSSSGGIYLVAQEDNGGAGDSLFTNNGAITMQGGNGEIEIVANNMDLGSLAGGSSISSLNGARIVLSDDPASSSTIAVQIGDGATDGINTLGLTNEELGTVSTLGTLQIGHSGSGAVTAGNIDLAGIGAVEINTSGDATFNGTIDGAFDLTVNSAGVTTFGGAVGGTTALTSLTTDAAGATSIGAGTIDVDGNTTTFNDAVTLTANLTITDTGNVTFASTVNSDNNATQRALSIDTDGEITFGGLLGGTVALSSLTADGAVTNMNGGGATTSSFQTYTGDVDLGADAVLSGGNITFNDDIFGPHNLTVTSTGLVTFDGHVGKESAADILTSLTVNGNTQINGQDIYTTGGQSYNGTVHLTGGTNLYSDTDLDDGNGFSSGDIAFTGNVTAEHNNLRIFTDGDITFGGDIGGGNSSTRVKILETFGGGTTNLNGSTVEVRDNVNFDNNVAIGTGVSVTSSQDDTIRFGGTVDGPGGLEIDTSGLVLLLGEVGGTTALSSLLVRSGVLPLVISKDITTNNGGQDYRRDVAVAGNVDFTDTGNGEIRFRDTLNGAVLNTFNVDISTGGAVRFDDKVGGVIQLGSLDVTAGATILANGGLISTTGHQTYNGVVGVQGTVFASTAGSLSFGTGITTTLPNSSLWLLAADDISIGGDIQWNGTGDVTLAAGWDGTTGWTFGATTADTAAIIAGNAFGAGTGDIFIGTGTQTGGIAVGSSNGETTVLTRNLALRGSDSNGGGYAQLGFQATDEGGGFAISGGIDVIATGMLSVQAGSQGNSYAQIGHVGADRGGFNAQTEAAADAAINITAAGNIEVTGGGGSEAYAQIGHGGKSARGQHAGAITIHNANDLIFSGGSAIGTYAQLGHGGYASNLNHSGAILITKANDISFLGGNGARAYAQLGHGGQNAAGNHSGSITITEANDLNFTAGSGGANGDSSYAQLGHGGRSADGDHSGMITITKANDLNFSGGNSAGTYAYAQLGHGGHDADGSHSGDILITEANDLTFLAGTSLRGAARLGHGGWAATGDHSGSITIASAHDLTLTGGGDTAAAQLGHGGTLTNGNHSGAISVVLDGNLSLTGGTHAAAFAQFGHGAGDFGSSGTRMGDISAIVGGLTTLTDETGGAWFGHATTTDGGVSNANVALVTTGLNTTGIPLVTTGLGNFAGMLQYNLLGGSVLIANRIAAATPDAGGFANQGFDDIIFTGPNFGRFTSSNQLTLAAGGDVVMLSSVQNEGDGGINLIGGWDGATGLDLSAFPMLDPDAVEAASAFGVTGGDVYIGDGSQTQDVRVGSRQGDIHVLAHDLEVRGSFVSSGDEARLGYRTGPVPGINSDIRIAVMDDVIVEGGTEDFTRAAIGHDNVESNGEIHGDITILGDTANDNVLAVLGGSGDSSYAQIGHEGCCAPIFGNIMIAGEDVVVQGGTNIFTDAQIGHYWDEATGNITINASGLFDVIGGDAPATYATVGHIGADSLTGEINITVGLDAFISGGGVFESDAQVGHFGDGQTSVVDGAINFSVLGNLDIWAGSDEDTAAYVGHAGIGGSASGNIDVDVGGTLTLWGSDYEDAWAQIGHSINDGANSGQIDVNAGVLDLLAGNDPESYAQIGHGDAAIDHSGTREGDINVIVTGEATLEDNGSGFAWIGHGTTTAGGVSNANVFLQAFGFDRDSGSTLAAGDLGTINKDIIEADIVGGNFTLIATGTGLLVEDPVYNSPHTVTMAVNNDLVLDTNAFFANSGTGDIILAASGDFHNDVGSLTPITTGGRWLVYSTRPDNNRNDIEITNWDFLRYATTFDINNPLIGTGNGLVYSVAPVVNFFVSSHTINYGETFSPTITQTLTVNGIQVDANAFGLGINPATAQWAYASFVTIDAAGNPVVGSYADGLTTGNETIPYFGISFLTNPGDLTVNGTGTTANDNPGTPTTTASNGIGGMCAYRSDDEDPEEGGPSFDRIIELCGVIESDTDKNL